MKRILMTGSTGFIGQNVLPLLQNNQFDIYAPTRAELNLKSESEVARCLKDGKFDTILHLANPTPGKNSLDSASTMTDDSLRIFLNLYNHSDLYGKMIYSGSGAEFDKSQDIDMITEPECFRSVPKDSYGLAKMAMNHMAIKSSNIYNFRIFGCYGPGDHESKFITHCIRSVLSGVPITIRKDCYFDYLHVFDLARFLEWGIESDMKMHDYNVTTASPILLSEIARLVVDSMGADNPVQLLSEERNLTYTADNTRILKESGLELLYPIEKGVEMQIQWEKENYK